MILLILLLLLNSQPGESAVFTLISTVFSFAVSAWESLNGAHDSYNKFKPQTSLDDVMDKIGTISEGMDKLQKRLEDKIEKAVEILLERLPQMQMVNEALSELSGHMVSIDNLFDTFLKYSTKKNVNNETLITLSERIIGFSSFDLQSTFDKINQLIKPKRTVALREGILELLAATTPPRTSTCNGGMKHANLLLNMFNLLMTAELRGWIMTSYAYVVLEEYKKLNYMAELEISRDRLLERTHEYRDIFREKGAVPSLEIRSCGTETPIFIQLYLYRQKYVINERSMADPPNCNMSCEKRPEPIRHYECLDSDGCKEAVKCTGELINCKRGPRPNIYANEKSDVIFTYDGTFTRFFETYAYEKDKWLGANFPSGVTHNINVRQDSNDNDCYTCVCECVNDGPTSLATRRFDFQSYTSDIEDNYVIIGVQMVSRWEMIQLSITQGQIKHQGYVDKKTVQVKSPKELSSNEKTIRRYGKLEYWTTENGTKRELKEEQDFGILKLNQDTINIDQIVVPKDYVVTDIIRFNYSEGDDEPKSIQLEVRATPYDFLIGNLIISDEFPSIWLKPSDMKGILPQYNRPRQELRLPPPIGRPDLMKGKLNSYPHINSFIKFQITSEETDAGQTVVPYLDKSPIVAHAPFALTGVAIEYRAISAREAGFLGIKLDMLDSLKYFQFDDE